MRDLIDMWGNTRMVVLTAMSASLYAAILIPFKVLPIIPGVTELRPANAVPVVCSFLFGPAAAWGAAIGNVIGDFFGGLGPGDMFGFVGNFLYGFIPYRAWELLSGDDPVPRSVGAWIKFVVVVAIASGACATTVGWGLNLLGFIPFRVLGNIVMFNNMAASLLLAPFLLSVIYPRAKRGRLLYRDVMAQPRAVSTARRRVGLLIVATAAFGGVVVGNLLSSGTLHPAFLPHSTGGTDAAAVGFGLLPVMALMALGVLLI
ncbi:MAG TPA: QueT transporter family protein [Candidatus Acidoferrales bacterium]|nr:QueT transporter family protein [Candidatus Acidoferrales bacterium]